MNHATHATFAGPFTILADDEGVVHAAGWTADPSELAALAQAAPLRSRRDVGPASAALAAYLAGDLAAPGTIPVSQRSGPVVERGWAILRALPPGTTITYAELATRCGRPGSARAASGACSRNAAALFVPCHRVVRTGGALGGFRWGLDVKRRLLEHEARHAG